MCKHDYDKDKSQRFSVLWRACHLFNNRVSLYFQILSIWVITWHLPSAIEIFQMISGRANEQSKHTSIYSILRDKLTVRNKMSPCWKCQKIISVVRLLTLI